MNIGIGNVIGIPFSRGRGIISVTVSYTPTTTVSNIEPGTVTWSANEFSVPSGVIEFSFEDDSNTLVFKYENGEWNLYEHVEYS